ncbi:diguanylate cyclase [Paenibacillus sp. YYML68]|uniref:diguanylate cyclase n=1 Tax=Paenibacillus sp. YYML68 TaxID=2909250 RepID=UPI0024912D00|nr:diguanylate cyclase [Paenibacillus sp. YYML68]
MLKGSNYEVLEVISDYGRKVVFRCRDMVTREKVIVKMLRAEYSTYDEVLRFKREYALLTELSGHVDGVIKPFKLEELGGLYVIVLEDIQGRSLKKLLAEETFDQGTLLQLAVSLVDILGGIHEQQVLHKDLKPSNIIWNTETGRVQIIDFDMSVKLLKEKQEYSNTGYIEGTLAYISPEQTGRINRSIDYRSDYYSLGVILYEMLTGVKPYDSSSMTEQVYSIIAKKPVSPFELTGGVVSRPLSDVIMKLLEKSPDNRYRSAYGIKADLMRCMASDEPFTIGSEDRLTLFQVSQKLYGRERELKELKAAFKASLKDSSQVVLVSGEAGVGKTALVGELHSQVSQERGYFIRGKFDQYNRNVAYSALSQAFSLLIAQLMNSEEVVRTAVKASLTRSLGDNAALLADLVPELKELLGVKSPLEPLNPTEETNRFYMTIIQFISGITGSERPLVLFLDDLQWADLSSIRLLESLAGNSSLMKLLVIGSYRSNEVTDVHPLSAAVAAIRKSKSVTHIELGPVGEKDVCALLRDTVGSEADWTGELGAIVYTKTKGNPFFVNELLKDLHKAGAISFDQRSGSWGMDLEKLQSLSLQDDLVAYLIDKIHTFPSSVQRILSLSASIGQLFDWNMLQLVAEEEPAVIAQALLFAIREDIVIPLQQHYQILSSLSEDSELYAGSLELSFTFQHDKIQQALYQMIELDLRKQLHLKIGRLLRQQLSGEQAEHIITDMASHFNKGLEFVDTDAELDAMIDMNLSAARKVKAAFGYDTALAYLRSAMQLLKPDCWSTHESRTFEIYRLFAECAYLTHQVEAGDEACAVLVKRSRSRMDIASIYEMQANHYTYLGMMQESMEAGKLGLKSLGLPVPAKVSMASVLRELIRVKLALKGRTADQLLSGPEVKDAEIKLMMRLLVSFIPPAFISGEQNLFGWVVLRKAYLSAKHGNSPESAGAYIGYSILLSGLGDLKGAKEFGGLAVRLNEKFQDLQWKSLVNVLYTLFCHSWSYSWNTLEEWYKKSVDSSLRSGDLLYLAHAHYYMNLWNPSMEIERYLQESVRSIAMIENTKYKEALATAKLARQKFRCLYGDLSNPLSFDDGSFKEEAYLEQLTAAKYFSGIAIFYVSKVQILYMFEHHMKALPYIELANNHISTLAGSAFMEEYSLYTFLNLTAVYSKLSFKEKAKARLRLRKEYTRMKKLASHCPDNFRQHELMMRAELHRIAGEYGDAETCYQEAIKTSVAGSFIRYKALAYELAAKFYYNRALKEIAAYYFRQAAYYYSVWGARGKVNQLEQAYPDYVSGLSRNTMSVDKTISTTTENIDLQAILQASQAMAREIHLDQLLETLLEIVIVNAGAQRGCIVMNPGSGLLVEGEYCPENDHITVNKRYVKHEEYYPKSVVDAVFEAQRTIIYHDATAETPFVYDPYIWSHRPKSVLCMPLMNQGKVTAIIYLENNLVTGAFTRDRLKMIDLLSREMVYSLENASLYSELGRSEEKYRQLVDHLTDGIVILQAGKIVFANEAMGELLGCELDQLLDESFDVFLHPSELDNVQVYYKQLQQSLGQSQEYEVRLKQHDGLQSLTVIFKAAVIQYQNEPAILGTVKDITERKLAEEELRKHRDTLGQLVEERTEELRHKNEQLNKYIDIVDKNVMIVQTDRNGVITSVSEEFCNITGFDSHELVGQEYRLWQRAAKPGSPLEPFRISALDMTGSSAVPWRGELVLPIGDDEQLWLDTVVEPVLDQDASVGFTYIFHNISDKKRIEQLSITDELTGLYNRRHFKSVFKQELERLASSQEILCFMLLDIDYYKKYNDTYGHMEGDHVLHKIGSTISRLLTGASDIGFRLGGEEFGVLYRAVSDEEVLRFAESLRATIESMNIPHAASEVHPYVTISAGVAAARCPVDRSSMPEKLLYRMADEALYSSKQSGRNQVTLRWLNEQQE